MTDVTIDGIAYRIGPLDLFAQFTLARKIAPVLAMFALQAEKDRRRESVPQSFVALTADLSLEDGALVVRTALSCIQRSVGSGWAPVMGGGRLMFDDLNDLGRAMRLVGAVIEAKGLIDFFAETSPAPGSGAPQPGSTSSVSPTERTG